MTLYVGLKPFKRLSSNRIELFNEFLMSSICYSLIIVTDYHPLADKKYEGAWFMILTIAFTMAANITIVIWFMLSNFKLLLKMFCGKRAMTYYRRH